MKKILLCFVFLSLKIKSFNNIYDSFVDSIVNEMSIEKNKIEYKEYATVILDNIDFIVSKNSFKDLNYDLNYSFRIGVDVFVKIYGISKVKRIKKYIENIKKKEETLIFKLKDNFLISLKFKILKEYSLIKDNILEEYSFLFENLVDLEYVKEELSDLNEKDYIISLDDLKKFVESEDVEDSISFLESKIEFKEKKYEKYEKCFSKINFKISKKNNDDFQYEFNINLVQLINTMKDYSYLVKFDDLNKKNDKINKLKLEIDRLFAKIERQNEKILTLRSKFNKKETQDQNSYLIFTHLLNVYIKDIEKLFDLIIEYKKINGHFIYKIINNSTKKVIL